MTCVAILPESQEPGALTYRAISGERHSIGRTAGEALDALTAQLPADQTSALIIVQNSRPDRFFTAQQQDRLRDLMQRWRDARTVGQSLEPAEQAELDALVEAELRATAARAASILAELRS